MEPLQSTTSKLSRPSAISLAPYRGPWDRLQAAHLLRRTLFGVRPEQLQQAVDLGLEATLDLLFQTEPAPTPPINYFKNDDPNVPIGNSWVDQPITPMTNGYKKRSLEIWWMNLMLHQGISLTEKMTLFWHNHFATELTIYNHPIYGYRHIKLLRDNCLGNFKSLVNEITVDGAMLRYLNGNQNSRQSPNENYARELFELFTLGKGPTIGEGDYTTYTEDDVQAAAKVLTGWVVRGNGEPDNLLRVEYIHNRHDRSDKKFSKNLGGETIFAQREGEYKLLIDLIFRQKATARYISKKLVMWFLHYEIDEIIESEIIEPLALQLEDQNFEIAPVLRTLLSSEFFFDAYFKGTMIRNPLDFIFTQVKSLKVKLPEASNFVEEGVLGEYLFLAAKDQQMAPLHPPSVAGWPAYYQTPQHYSLWVNSVTLVERRKLPTTLARGFRRRGTQFTFDLIAHLVHVEDPFDPNAVVQSFAELLLPLPLEEDQIAIYKDALIPGLPDYEWSMEYGEFLANPDDMAQRGSLERKLQALVGSMLEAPEFHLS